MVELRWAVKIVHPRVAPTKVLQWRWTLGYAQDSISEIKATWSEWEDVPSVIIPRKRKK